MIKINKEKFEVARRAIRERLKQIADDVNFYARTGIKKTCFDKTMKSIELSTNKTPEEIIDFVKSNIISYADLEWFASTCAYRRFPNKTECGLLYHGLRDMLQIAAIKHTTVDQLWPHLSK